MADVFCSLVNLLVFFSSFIQINFDPRSMECKYTLINMGEMISSELWWAEINRGSDGSKLQF